TRGAGRAVSVHLHETGKDFTDGSHNQAGVGHDAVLPQALHREVLAQRVAEDGDGIAAREAARIARGSHDSRRAAPDVAAHAAEVRGIGDSDQTAREPLPAPRELDSDPLRAPAPLLPP